MVQKDTRLIYENSACGQSQLAITSSTFKYLVQLRRQLKVNMERTSPRPRPLVTQSSTEGSCRESSQSHNRQETPLPKEEHRLCQGWRKSHPTGELHHRCPCCSSRLAAESRPRPAAADPQAYYLNNPPTNHAHLLQFYLAGCQRELPWEEHIDEARERKCAKYQELTEQCRTKAGPSAVSL